jgi:hypothetical protein
MLSVTTMLKIPMSYSRHHSWNPKMSLIKLFWVGKASALGGFLVQERREVPVNPEIPSQEEFKQ